MKCQHCGKPAAKSVQEAVESIKRNMQLSGIEILITRYNCQACKAGLERVKLSTGTN